MQVHCKQKLDKLRWETIFNYIVGPSQLEQRQRALVTVNVHVTYAVRRYEKYDLVQSRSCRIVQQVIPVFSRLPWCASSPFACHRQPCLQTLDAWWLRTHPPAWIAHWVRPGPGIHTGRHYRWRPHSSTCTSLLCPPRPLPGSCRDPPYAGNKDIPVCCWRSDLMQNNSLEVPQKVLSKSKKKKHKQERWITMIHNAECF